MDNKPVQRGQEADDPGAGSAGPTGRSRSEAVGRWPAPTGEPAAPIQPRWGPPAARVASPVGERPSADETPAGRGWSAYGSDWSTDGTSAAGDRSSATAVEGPSGSGSIRVPSWLLLSTLVAALLLNFAVRSRLNSAATLMAVVIMVALVMTAPGRRRQPASLVGVGIAFLSAAVAVLRDSPWVTVPALLISAAGLVLAGQGRLLGVGLMATAGRQAHHLLSSVRWITGPVTIGGRAGSRIPAARAIALAVMAVVPLAMLLASADAVFGQLLRSLGRGAVWQHVVITALMVPPVASVAHAARRRIAPAAGPLSAASSTIGRISGSGSMTEATAVLGSVAVLLGLWGATQVVVALGGAGRLLTTANLTAAENARQGFFQLVAATAFLLLVVIGIDRLTTRASATDRRRFLVLTSLIAVETIGLVITTYARLSLYIAGFGNTMLRLSVAWFLAWLAVVMIVVVVVVNRTDSAEPGAGLGLGGGLFVLAGLWVIAFGLWNPEAVVARGNLERDQTAAAIDHRYLTEGLGADAVPVVIQRLDFLEVPQRQSVINALCDEQHQDTSGYWLFSWNRSTSRAEAAIDSLRC